MDTMASGSIRVSKLLLVSLTAALLAGPAEAAIVLWNKLGSLEQVKNSEVGPGGTVLLPEFAAFEPGKFGNGYIRQTTHVGETTAMVNFPGSVLHGLNERGTIELWINANVAKPKPYDYGFFALVGTSNAPYPLQRGNVWLIWGDGVTGRGLQGGVSFDEQLAVTPPEPVQFTATPGEPFHVAIAWDIDGIGGTNHTVRVYRDGIVVGSTSSPWNPDGTRLDDKFWLGTGPDANGFDKFVTDNIKVHDVAITCFTQDCFSLLDSEAPFPFIPAPPQVPVPASFILLGSALLGLASLSRSNRGR